MTGSVKEAEPAYGYGCNAVVGVSVKCSAGENSSCVVDDGRAGADSGAVCDYVYAASVKRAYEAKESSGDECSDGGGAAGVSASVDG